MNPVPDPDWRDRAQQIAYRVEIERPYVGSLGLDEPGYGRLATQEVDRAGGLGAGLTNHYLAEGDDEDLRVGAAPDRRTDAGDPRRRRPDVPAPPRRDPGPEIPGAVLVPVPGMGHEIPPPPTWDLVVPRLVEHTGRDR